MIFVISVLSSCKRENISELSDSFHLKSNGSDMPVHVFGNATDQTFIILLHGGPGDNGLAYRSGMYAEKLEERYAMVYWDQRGQGMSQGSFTKDNLTVNEMAEDLYNLILTLKLKYGQNISIFLMGHSWGGTLGTYFMVKDSYQEMINGWIEVDGAHDIPLLNKVVVEMFDTIGTAQIALGNSKSEWRRLVKWANNIDTSNINLNVGSEINSNAFYAEDLLWEDGIIKDESEYPKIWDIISSPVNFLTSLYSGAMTNSITLNEVEFISLSNQLYKITKPTLLLWGKYDFVVSPYLATDAYNKISSSHKKVVIFENSGHSPMDCEPQLFIDEVINFVDQHR